LPQLKRPLLPAPASLPVRSELGRSLPPCRRLRPPVLLSLLALVGLGCYEPAAAQPRYDFPTDTTRVADQSLYFETNLGLIERATSDAVDQALEGLRLPPGSDILLHCMTARDDAWFVEDYIARRLNQQGYNVHTAEEAREAAGGPAPAPQTPPSSAPSSLGDALRTTAKAPTDSAAADSAAADSVVSSPAAPARKPGPAAAQNAPNNGQEELIPVPEGQGLVLTYRLVEFGVTYHDSWRRGFLGPRVVERLASVNLYCRLVSGGPKNVLWVGSGKSERLDIVPKSKLDLLEGLSYPFTKPTLRPQPLSRFLEPVLVTSIIGGLVYLFYTNQE
jgi:hypothetical protein